MLPRALLLALVCALVPLQAAAQPARPRAVRLSGNLAQGGLVFGTTEPGATVTLDGRPLRVGDDGTFVFGLGYRAKARATLKVVLPSGRAVTRPLAIRRRTFRVQRIDDLPDAMVTPPPEVLARLDAERARFAALRDVDSPELLCRGGFIRPAKGPVTGVYGSQRILNGIPRAPHWGLDIAAPEGAPVIAPAAGIVLLADPDLYLTGGTVLLDHGFGIVSAFLHLSALDVSEGQRVEQGDVIGRVGATGRATGPHLDWRVRWFDVFVDPQLLLRRAGTTAR